MFYPFSKFNSLQLFPFFRFIILFNVCECFICMYVRHVCV